MTHNMNVQNFLLIQLLTRKPISRGNFSAVFRNNQTVCFSLMVMTVKNSNRIKRLTSPQ